MIGTSSTRPNSGRNAEWRHNGAEERRLILRKVAEPCRNFNFLTLIRLIDPLDGKEKVVLSNFVMDGVGTLIFVDPKTGEAESIEIPSDFGCWALYLLDDSELLVGTCPQSGQLHRLDLASRRWTDTARIKTETYIWNLDRASDGNIYGGTWPGCALLRYDPRRRVLERVCRGSDDPADEYVREVYGQVPGYVLFTGGYAHPFLAAWDIAGQRVLRLLTSPDQQPPRLIGFADGWFSAERNGVTHYFDSGTLQPIDRPAEAVPGERTVATSPQTVQLSDGRTFGIAGQEYVLRTGGAEPEYRRVPTEAPATRIHTVTIDDDGLVWGSCGFGQTIFSYNPDHGREWNSAVVSDRNGEVYGMVAWNGKIHLAAYSGGDLIVYDPRLPWDQRANSNPKTIATLHPDLIRPLGLSILGPDGCIWTGWSAGYGRYGGGLSRVDPKTETVTVFRDIVADQQVIRLTADQSLLYVLTDGGGNGLPARDIPGHLAAFTTDGTAVFDRLLEPDLGAVSLLAHNGSLLLGVADGIGVFDLQTQSFSRRIDLGSPARILIAESDATVLAFTARSVWRVDLVSGTARFLADLPESPSSAARAADGCCWIAINKTLYVLSPYR